jgi:hypothetical protein
MDKRLEDEFRELLKQLTPQDLRRVLWRVRLLMVRQQIRELPGRWAAWPVGRLDVETPIDFVAHDNLHSHNQKPPNFGRFLLFKHQRPWRGRWQDIDFKAGRSKVCSKYTPY